MTRLQKQILIHLLNGATVYNARADKFRVRDSDSNVIMKFSSRTFKCLRPLLRKERKLPLYRLDKNEVRRLRKGTWLKKEYNQMLKAKC